MNDIIVNNIVLIVKHDMIRQVISNMVPDMVRSIVREEVSSGGGDQCTRGDDHCTGGGDQSTRGGTHSTGGGDQSTRGGMIGVAVIL